MLILAFQPCLFTSVNRVWQDKKVGSDLVLEILCYLLRCEGKIGVSALRSLVLDRIFWINFGVRLNFIVNFGLKVL